MSGVQPFQFEPTYSPGEEPAESEEEIGEEELLNFNARVGNTEWCICGGNCTAMPKADECFCCQELDALNAKFDESVIECITSHAKLGLCASILMCYILLLWQFTTRAVIPCRILSRTG